MSKRKVILLGWDAADWKIINPLIDAGHLPNMARMIETGTMGNLMTLQPVLSPMLWNSIGSGKRADKHGIHGFTTVDKKTGRVRPYGSMDRQVKALWNILSQRGYNTHLLNWFCGHPAEPINGICVTEQLVRQSMDLILDGETPDAPPGSIYPEALIDELSALRVFPDDLDTESVALFIPKITEVDLEKDARPTQIAKQTAAAMTTHALITHIIEHKEWDFIAAYWGEIDHFCHGFMKYHPPRMPNVPEVDFEIYKDVVIGAYIMHDHMLGRISQLAGPDATILLCSDHGYQSDHLRPGGFARVPTGPADEHRPVGIIGLHGPGIKKDELVHGANLLDIAPTVLALFDEPIGEDMEGRALVDAFETEPELQYIPSWENEDGPHAAGMPDPASSLTDEEANSLMEQFVALGYIDAPSGNDAEQARLTQCECDWNLARVFMNTGQYRKALPLLDRIYGEYPLRFDYGFRLAECLFRIGFAEEGSDLADKLAAVTPEHPRSLFLKGLAALQLRKREEALKHFQEAEHANLQNPDLYLRIGMCYGGLHRPDDALKAFEKALELDPDHALAHLRKANALYRLKRYDESAGSALDALGLEFGLAQAHLALGMALIRLELLEDAQDALENAARFSPDAPAPRRLLRALYKTLGKDEDLQRINQEIVAANKQRAAKQEQMKQARERLHAERKTREERKLKEADDFTADLLAEAARPAVERPAADAAPGSSGKCFTIVSGLPRSGTSLMMQMLVAAGLDPMTDGARVADEDNPEGYLEWEAIKQLPRNPRIIERAEGKVTKVISMLLPRLTAWHQYKIIYMDRPLEQVEASQRKMIDRKGAQKPGETEKVLEQLGTHRKQVLAWMEKSPHIDLLLLSFPEVIADPIAASKQVAAFLEGSLDEQVMAQVVNPELFRNRGEE